MSKIPPKLVQSPFDPTELSLAFAVVHDLKDKTYGRRAPEREEKGERRAVASPR
jgi:hypothetical protein